MAKEMENSILLYAVSTITDRALPNVYDGCKPVIRRILYGGYTHKYLPEKQHIKCATYAGQVMSDCHPHGAHNVV
ncbi:MAG: hypothetical protein IJ641_08520 [Lachnospiraceae bacterium]|nr:hypothetical protein [Lachnospiraceae bacterium]